MIHLSFLFTLGLMYWYHGLHNINALPETTLDQIYWKGYTYIVLDVSRSFLYLIISVTKAVD